jgi:hypothetical protein
MSSYIPIMVVLMQRTGQAGYVFLHFHHGDAHIAQGYEVLRFMRAKLGAKMFTRVRTVSPRPSHLLSLFQACFLYTTARENRLCTSKYIILADSNPPF